MKFINLLCKKLAKKTQQHNSLKQAIANEQANLKQSKRHVAHVEEASQIIQGIAKHVQQKAHKQIASVVTRCLETIFDDPYEFKIEFEVKRGKTEARLVFLRDGNEVDPTTASGGGAVDVASFALRLACIVLSRPRLRRLIVLDEPFKFLHSAVYRERVCKMLNTLAKKMNVQFIMVTGITELRTGKVIELE